jgi:hypothetical protein
MLGRAQNDTTKLWKEWKRNMHVGYKQIELENDRAHMEGEVKGQIRIARQTEAEPGGTK